MHADTGIAPHLDPATQAAINAGSSSGGGRGGGDDDGERGSSAPHGTGAPLFTPDELLAMRGYLGPLLRVAPGIEVFSMEVLT